MEIPELKDLVVLLYLVSLVKTGKSLVGSESTCTSRNIVRFGIAGRHLVLLKLATVLYYTVKWFPGNSCRGIAQKLHTHEIPPQVVLFKAPGFIHILLHAGYHIKSTVKNILDRALPSDNEAIEHAVRGLHGGGCSLTEGEVLRCVSSGPLPDGWEVGGFLVVSRRGR